MVIGYGNKGQAAIRALRDAGEHDPQFVVVDTSASAAQKATGDKAGSGATGTRL